MIRIEHLETDVTQACNLSCVGCNHEVPLWRALKGGPWRADPAQVERDLNHLATIMHADRWGALGGEPLLHPRLVDILRAARASGVADRTEVWTNGMMIDRMKSDFWESFDILVVSAYPGKQTDESLESIARRCEQSGVEFVLKDERRHPNFRTLLEPHPTDDKATRSKFKGCFFRSFSRSANYGFFFTCCCAPSMPMLIQGKPYGTDGVAIDGLTEAGLRSYLDRSEPLGCCSICAGRDTAVQLQWREERDPKKWMIASGASPGVKSHCLGCGIDFDGDGSCPRCGASYEIKPLERPGASA